MLSLCSDDKREKKKTAINSGYLKGVLNAFSKKEEKRTDKSSSFFFVILSSNILHL
jgi:hypothetical protein